LFLKFVCASREMVARSVVEQSSMIKPYIRVVTLQTVLADLRDNPRPFLAANREQLESKWVELSDQIFGYLPATFTGDLLIALTSIHELRAAGIPMGQKVADFVAGEAILLWPSVVHEIPARPQSRPVVGELQQRAHDGVRVVVALGTERLRACIDCREHKRRGADVRRADIFAELQSHFADLDVENVFRERHQVLRSWYPGQTARSVLKSAYASVATLPGVGRGRVDLDRLEQQEKDLVRTAAAVYAKTKAYLSAKYSASGRMRELMDEEAYRQGGADERHIMMADLLRTCAPVEHQVMAHDEQTSPSLPQFMRAVIAMDFNPAWVFGNVRAYSGEFECAMLLARLKRGADITLEPEHVHRLKHFMEIAAVDDHDESERQAALILRDLALRLKSREAWDEVFESSFADLPLWIPAARRP
jgi:hypothetical protein